MLYMMSNHRYANPRDSVSNDGEIKNNNNNNFLGDIVTRL